MMQRKFAFVYQAATACGLLLALCLCLTSRPTVQAQSPAEPTAAHGQSSPVQPSSPTFHDNVVTFWNEEALQAIRFSRGGPPIIARALAMVHTAQYEAWAQFDDTAVGTLLGAKFRQAPEKRTEHNKNVALSYAAYRVLLDLFPDLSFLFDFAMREHGLDPAIQTTNPDTPAGLGNLAAAIVLHYRHHDGANQLGDRHPGSYSDYTGYVPVNAPQQVNDLNRWQPLQTPNGSFQGGCSGGTELITQSYVGPHWGNVTPFALNDGAPITPTVQPARYPSPEFTLQVQEVLSISAHLTDREKAISEYWADGPASELPPGHWALIAQQISLRDHHTIDEDAKLFFALTNANLDASILAWKLKRIYDSVRPVTAIRELYRGQTIQAWAGPYSGTQAIRGESWQPYQQTCFVTPAFPEFVSGHSAFSAASAEILKSFTGSDVYSHTVTILKGNSFIEPGRTPASDITLFWPTFSAAADQAGISRRYGGIHFERGDLEGRQLGRQVGARAWQKAQGFFAGSAAPVAQLDAEIARFVALNHFEDIFRPNRAYLPVVVSSYPQAPPPAVQPLLPTR